MATTPASPHAPSLTGALVTATKPQLQALLSHGWTTQAFTEELGARGAIRTWAQQNGPLSRYRIRALQQLLKYNPPASLRDLILDLINRGDQEPASLLTDLRAEPAIRPELVTEGWGCWLYVQASDGLLEGCTAILIAQLADRAMFAAIDATCPPHSVWRERADQWASPQSAELAGQLSDAVDDLAAPCDLPQLLPRLRSVAQQGLRWQKVYLDLCWFGQGLPV